jgi:hypothetical protein
MQEVPAAAASPATTRLMPPTTPINEVLSPLMKDTVPTRAMMTKGPTWSGGWPSAPSWKLAMAWMRFMDVAFGGPRVISIRTIGEPAFPDQDRLVVGATDWMASQGFSEPACSSSCTN